MIAKGLNYWFYQDRGAHLAACQLPFIVALAGKNNVISCRYNVYLSVSDQ